ncbi:DUF1120 domain-containing protein [Pseudomonas fluorescens]|uniref:DUF1120 domain-containing protein n=1 Tax=Pseudomonas fluorescens TaxID=294 RepID=UPI0009374F4A|nr:DUF1120 domain-containing protein [Pseudomonas fluorescens]
MSFSKKVLLGSLLALCTTSVFAVDSADLRVIGTIAPAACTPTFAGGGTVDYGLISTSSLNAATATPLAKKTIDYNITCDAPISISTAFTDSRAGTAFIPGPASFGLGMQGAATIGRYTVAHVVGSATGDGNAVVILQQNNPTRPWAATVTGDVYHDGLRTYSYGSAASPDTPGTYTTVTGTLAVTATIAPTDTLNLSETITLDGLSTMTVRYP